MRIFLSLFGVLLLVGGVSCVEGKKVTLSVMKGDTVTLKPDDAKIQTDDQIMWKFEGSIIANIKKDGDFATFDVPNGRFKEKLLPDKQTGSLTITNLTTDHTGIYQLEIKSTTEIFQNYSVTVHETDNVESVPVMKGDSVTLRTGVEIQGHDQILWKFGDQVTIAHLNGPVDGRRTNFNLNNKTGELTIIDIQSDQTGVYKMEINTSSMILHRKFNIIISDEMKTETVKEGEPVTLHTGLTDITGYDLTWKSEDQLMAEIDRKTKRFSVYNSPDGKFKGRLQRNENTGSLTIRDTRTSDSGDYHLKMSSDSHSLQRSINVTVKDPSPSGAASGICGAGVGLVVWALTVFLLQEV